MYITSCFPLVYQPPSFLISCGLVLLALPFQRWSAYRQAHFSRPAVPSPLICVCTNLYHWVLGTLECSPSSFPDGVPQSFGLTNGVLLTSLKPSLANVVLSTLDYLCSMLFCFLVPAFITTSAFNKERTRQVVSPQWSADTEDTG